MLYLYGPVPLAYNLQFDPSPTSSDGNPTFFDRYNRPRHPLTVIFLGVWDREEVFVWYWQEAAV